MEDSDTDEAPPCHAPSSAPRHDSPLTLIDSSHSPPTLKKINLQTPPKFTSTPVSRTGSRRVTSVRKPPRQIVEFAEKAGIKALPEKREDEDLSNSEVEK